MKKAVLFFLSLTLFIQSAVSVKAVPDNEALEETRQEYTEIQNRVQELKDGIYQIEGEMEQIQQDINKNEETIEKINKEISKNEQKMEETNNNINLLDKLIGKRLNSIYLNKAFDFDYILMILKAESFKEILDRHYYYKVVLDKDKDMMKSMNSNENELKIEKEQLETYAEQFKTVNEENEKKITELENKKAEQEILIQNADNEEKQYDEQYLSVLEREAVSPQFDIIDSESSTSVQIEAAVSQLTAVKDNQLKSETVIKETEQEIEKGKKAFEEKKKEEEKDSEKIREEIKIAQKRMTQGINTYNYNTYSVPYSASSVNNASEIKILAVLNEAYKHLGKTYVFGAEGPDTFDCSGLTSYVYREALGIDITRTTYTQLEVGMPVERENLQPGDLVFPHTGHVGIYVGNDQMLHAPHTGDVVKISKISKFYAGRRIIA